MISDKDRYHGVVLAELAAACKPDVTVGTLGRELMHAYLINGDTPLFVKYTTKRKGPWVFNFHVDHQTVCQLLVETYGGCLIAFVCGSDGVVALKYDELKSVLDEDYEQQEAVIISRKRNQMYSVSGSDGKLGHKINRKRLPTLIANHDLGSEKFE